jgi:hypothetical protein
MDMDMDMDIKIYEKDNYVSYEVVKLEDLINVIIPHFNKYSLLTEKLIFYYLNKWWK